jgi:hypothetical protein
MAGLWMRVDYYDVVLAFDNIQNRGVKKNQRLGEI